MESGYYPLGADTPDAPWNEEDNIKEVEVTISLSMSKTFTLKINPDYIKEEIENGITLPNELANSIDVMFTEDLDLKRAGMPLYLKESIEDCKGWCVDDYDYIIEE